MNMEQAFCNSDTVQYFDVAPSSVAKQQPLTDVLWDKTGETIEWACNGLGYPSDSLRVFLSLAIFWQGRLVGALLFHDGYAQKDVWWTIYTTDKHWCQRRLLRKMFRVAFCDLKCHRIGILVQATNEKSLKLVRGLGFVQEGILRQLGENKEDCFVFSMLKSECRYL